MQISGDLAGYGGFGASGYRGGDSYGFYGAFFGILLGLPLAAVTGAGIAKNPGTVYSVGKGVTTRALAWSLKPSVQVTAASYVSYRDDQADIAAIKRGDDWRIGIGWEYRPYILNQVRWGNQWTHLPLAIPYLMPTWDIKTTPKNKTSAPVSQTKVTPSSMESLTAWLAPDTAPVIYGGGRGKSSRKSSSTWIRKKKKY